MVVDMPWSVALFLLVYAALGAGFVYCVVKALLAASDAAAARDAIQSILESDD